MSFSVRTYMFSSWCPDRGSSQQTPHLGYLIPHLTHPQPPTPHSTALQQLRGIEQGWALSSHLLASTPTAPEYRIPTWWLPTSVSLMSAQEEDNSWKCSQGPLVPTEPQSLTFTWDYLLIQLHFFHKISYWFSFIFHAQLVPFPAFFSCSIYVL